MQVKKSILEKISSGTYPKGAKIPSSFELCDKFQVSLITVRRAITDLISEGILKGVFGKGVYVESASSLNEDDKLLVASIFHVFGGNFFFPEIFQGISDALEIFDYKSMLATSKEDSAIESAQIQELRRRKAKGVVMTPVARDRRREDTEYLRSLCEEGFPLVFVDLEIPEVKTDCVVTDNEKAVFEAVSELASQGHRRIAFIRPGERISTIEERLKGYMRAVETARLDFNPELIRETPPGMDRAMAGAGCVRALLDLKERPTALFVCTDASAAGASRVLQERGLATGSGAVSLVCYDESPTSLNIFPRPGIVRQPLYEMGKEAGKMLLKRMSGWDAPAERRVLKSVFKAGERCA